MDSFLDRRWEIAHGVQEVLRSKQAARAEGEARSLKASDSDPLSAGEEAITEWKSEVLSPTYTEYSKEVPLMEELREVNTRADVEPFARAIYILLGGADDPEVSSLACGILMALAHLHLDCRDEHRSDWIKKFREANHKVLREQIEEARERCEYLERLSRRVKLERELLERKAIRDAERGLAHEGATHSDPSRVCGEAVREERVELRSKAALVGDLTALLRLVALSEHQA